MRRFWSWLLDGRHAEYATIAFVAALGVISGGISLVAYVLTYIWLARHGWQVAIAGSLLVFLVSTALLRDFTFPLIPIFIVVCTALWLALRLMPNDPVQGRDVPPGAWDIPARIIIGTSFILLLTGIAPFIGSHLTGLLTTAPLYVSILTVFAHRYQGAAAAAHVLRGLLYGLFAFASFFLVLNLLLERAWIAVAFLSAIAVALAIQGTSLWVLRQTQK